MINGYKITRFQRKVLRRNDFANQSSYRYRVGLIVAFAGKVSEAANFAQKSGQHHLRNDRIESLCRRIGASFGSGEWGCPKRASSRIQKHSGRDPYSLIWLGDPGSGSGMTKWITFLQYLALFLQPRVYEHDAPAGVFCFAQARNQVGFEER
ncbi:MAG: hypothetical protein ACQERO_04585 [Bacteroidota bacterium]